MVIRNRRLMKSLNDCAPALNNAGADLQSRLDGITDEVKAAGCQNYIIFSLSQELYVLLCV